jgi:hypothetical protein
MRSLKEGTAASRSGSSNDKQEWGKKCFLRIGRSEEHGETSNTYMEYGLSPPRRIESRRNRAMDEKQVHTMATAEKIAPDGDWYISLWTADAKVQIQENGDVHVVSEGA